MPIPLRNFGKTGIQISALGLGGHHLGGAKEEKTAIEIVHLKQTSSVVALGAGGPLMAVMLSRTFGRVYSAQ
jgi:hypothetical protein